MSEEKLDALLKPLIKNALKLELKADDTAIKPCCESKFGGQPYAEKGDNWPACPKCKDPLSFINQIVDDKEETLFAFYYCNTCFPWGLGDEETGLWVAKFYDRPSPEKMVVISRNDDQHALVPCKVTSSAVRVLPDWDALDSISSEASSLCCEISQDAPWEVYDEAVERAGCLNDYATLVGGYPRYVQGEVCPKCKECSADMEFYAQVDSEEQANLMWGDVGLVYIFRCPTHGDHFQLELQCH